MRSFRPCASSFLPQVVARASTRCSGRRRGHALHAAAWVLVAHLASGCGQSAQQALAEQRQAIEGEVDEEHRGVFRVISRKAGLNGLCSSTLIAPNLLLTARHCVASVPDAAIECERTRFEPALEPSELMFANDTAPVLTSTWYGATRVLVREETNALCGNDIALVVLERSVAPGEARIHAPRLSTVAAGEAYSAVGYGADTSGAQAEYGVRRSLTELHVSCVGSACNANQLRVTDAEFIGSSGACQGDSGGPALDEQGRVMGVLSRGQGQCESPVYTSPQAFEPWLIAGAELAAQLAGGGLQPWAGGDATPPEPSHSAVDAGQAAQPQQRLAPEQGCNAASRGSRGTTSQLWLAAGFVVLGRLLKTRRRP